MDETGQVEAASRGLALAHFRGQVDVEHGTITFEAIEPPRSMPRWGSGVRQPRTEVAIAQDGVPGRGPPNTVELVPTRTATEREACGGLNRFCGEVTLRSFYAVPLHDVWVELDAMAPGTGFESYNSSTTVPPGLANRFGLWSYGDLEPQGGSNTARWGFNLPAGQRENFSFTGRVMATVTASDAPVANAGPDTPQTVFTGDVVQLDGRGSLDGQGRPLTYRWSVLSRPAGSIAPLLNANTATPTIETDLPGDYVLELIVNNGLEDSAPDTLTLTSVIRNTILVSSVNLRTSSSSTMTVTLGSPTGLSQQCVNLSSNDSLIATVPGSVCVGSRERSASFTVTTGTRTGTATITAFATNFLDGTGEVGVSHRRMSLSLPSPLVGLDRELEGTLTLTDPAPAGGVTVTLSSNANNVVSLVDPPGASLAFAAGESTRTFKVKGLAEGSATFTVQAVGYSNATVSVSVTASATLTIPGGVVVAPSQTLAFPVSLSTPAPAGGVTVQLTSAVPGVVQVTPSVFIPEGATTPSVQPTVTGVTLGTAGITAIAPGYAPDTRTVDVRLSMGFSPSSLSVLVDNTGSLVLSLSAPAPAGGVTVDLWTDNPARASVPGTVTFPAGESQATVTVTGVSAGTTTLRASGTGLNQVTASLTVNPAPFITLSANPHVGKDMQGTTGGSLGVAAPAGNLNVTLTSADPSRLLLATAAGAPGSASITVQVMAGATHLPAIYLYGLDSSGTVQLTATGTGYARATAAVTLNPSGFQFPTNITSITTASFSANTSLGISLVELDPVNRTVISSGALRPGVSVSVPVSSSDVTVGVMTPSPVVFNAGDSRNNTAFDPIGGGTATLLLTQPAGFMPPSTGTQLTATVTAPGMSLGGLTLGKDLQASLTGYLGTAAPAGGVPVTLTVSDPSKALLSTSATTVGSGSLTLNMTAGTTATSSFYVQALAGSGTVQLRMSAPGYTATTSTVTLAPSGVTLLYCNRFCDTSFGTTTLSANSPLLLSLGRLNATTLALEATQPLRPGAAPLVVNVTSSNPSVGTIVNSPAAFSTNQSSLSTAEFDPLSAGTSTLTIDTPAGFTRPSNNQQVTATVSMPTMSVSTLTLGKDLQATMTVGLDTAAPAGNAQVTVTVADPTRVRLSTSSDVLGGESLTFTVFAGTTHTPNIYVQALAGSGTVQFTASAPGYTSKTGTLTLVPSGVTMAKCGSYCESSFGTTTFAANTGLTLFMVRLKPGTLLSDGAQPLRPGVGPVSVSVTSSNPTVGTLTTSPVTFTTHQSTATTQFDPVNAGTSILTIGTPAGFSTPSDGQQVTATVTAPNLGLGDLTLGKDLQASTTVSLGAAAPSGGIPVTVTVADPSKAVLSTSATTLGGNSLTLNVAAGGYSTPDIHVQALAGSGTVQYTVSAPGYNSKTGTLTLVPSGVTMAKCGSYCDSSFGTTTFAANTGLTLFMVRLKPGTLLSDGAQPLRPGVGPVSVNVTSSNPTVGTLTTSPVIFTTNQSAATTQFDPANGGTSILSIGTPAGFSTPSDGQQVTATVTAPNLGLGDLTLGKDLQASTTVSLGAAAPAGGVPVTITVADPAKAVLSTSATTLGGNSLTFTLAAGTTQTPTIHVQALAGSGTVQYTASAPGYNSKTSTLTLVPSGVTLAKCGSSCDSSFGTTSVAANTWLTLYMVRLNADTLLSEGAQPLRPGVGPVSVNVTSSNPTVGTLTTSPVTFTTHQSTATTQFDPVNAGTSILAIDTPVGFSTPSDGQQVTATVTAPDLGLGDLTLGKDLEVSTTVSLGAAAPAGGVPVTITVADPAKAVLSSSAYTLGSGSLTFTLAAGATQTPAIHVQALAGSGTVQYTVSAPGYNSKTATLTLVPSGFVIAGFSTTGSFDTLVSASDTTLNVYPAALDPVTMNLQATQLLRPGLANVNVTVTSSNPSVGTLTLSPVVFNNGPDTPNYRTTSFHPVSVGTTTLVVTGPAGFSQASNNNHITARVTQ
ncbi:Fibronectin type III domain protein [Archangium gephyra]|uniref:Fibronectin type III domain protein n=2 Tax=Archangium gephyra TaxID=48 RepID=A0AAC8QC25_9BACT|nr:Fibronectin type III domain protein [Archangium gephyra]